MSHIPLVSRDPGHKNSAVCFVQSVTAGDLTTLSPQQWLGEQMSGLGWGIGKERFVFEHQQRRYGYKSVRFQDGLAW